MRDSNIVFLYKRQEKEILLAMKKRSFGVGKWNGVGGKVDLGETVTQSAVREAKEEIGVDIKEKDLEKVAVIDFFFENNPDWNQRAHVFFVEKWAGEPRETEEMMPKWYKTIDIPYDSMWVDDPHWLPRVLKGEKIDAIFTFNSTGEALINKEVKLMI